jgi:alpha-galactosidase
MHTLRMAVLLLCGMAAAAAANSGGAVTGPSADNSDPAMSNARRWLAAKFLDRADNPPSSAQMLVNLKAGAIQKNHRRDRALLIKDRRYPRGLAMPSPGEITIRLPEPAASFEAVVGVDSNDLGYYANTGRGSVVASVTAGDRELFRSDTLHEGLPGVPIKVDLAGAHEFILKLTAVGERSRTYQAEWDQADWADARITLASGAVLRLDDLPVGPMPGAYSQGPPFSFRYADQPSSDLLKNMSVSRSTRIIDSHRTEYVSLYRDAETGLEIKAAAVAYDDFPVIEWTLFFKNNGDKPTPILENIQALDTSFERTLDREFNLHHSTGSPNSPTDYQPLESALGPKSEKRFVARGGRPTDTNLCYFNLEWASSGVIVGLGWPGQWAALFTRDEGTGVRVAAGQELTHFRLLPGEEVRSPLVALMFWEGDWIGAQNGWRRWMVAHNLPRPGGKLPPPHLAGGSNRQTIEMQDANEENQLRFLTRNLDAGLKLNYWWMDAGWYPFKAGWWETGTWDPDPERFPHGFAPISVAAHARGVKIIVWFEPERVTPVSWLNEKHPEWLLGQDGGNKLLDLGNPQAWQWLVDHVSGMIREQGIDLYRQDFNFEPLPYWRSNDKEDRQGITEIKHVMGYLAYFDELRRRFPNLLIDTCASGGRRNDLETLRRAVPLWRSDFAFEPAAMQQLTYGMALWIPYFGTAFNSLDPYIFRSQMTPATAVGLTPESQERGYERLGGLIADWRRAADYYYGDYYPLTPYRTDASEWMAWQFNRPEQGDGMVQAFRRPECTYESARYRLRGLDAAARYDIVDIDTKRVSGLTGRDLMERGLPVSISALPGAVIITYKKHAAGRGSN